MQYVRKISEAWKGTVTSVFDSLESKQDGTQKSKQLLNHYFFCRDKDICLYKTVLK